jgi:hypothetical protein
MSEISVTFVTEAEYRSWRRKIYDYMQKCGYKSTGRKPQKGPKYKVKYLLMFNGKKEELMAEWDFCWNPDVGRGELRLTLDGFVVEGLIAEIQKQVRVYMGHRQEV